MAGEKILIVDDSLFNLKLARVVLVADGFEVETAMDATEACSKLETFRPELILMDIQLPGTDGLQLTRQLKADPEYRGITVVALTSYAMLGDEAKAMDAGCEGYLTKPIDTRSLGATVASFLFKRESPEHDLTPRR